MVRNSHSNCFLPVSYIHKNLIFYIYRQNKYNYFEQSINIAQVNVIEVFLWSKLRIFLVTFLF